MKEAGLKEMKPLGPHLNAETPAVYVVTKEKVGIVRNVAADLEYLL